MPEVQILSLKRSLPFEILKEIIDHLADALRHDTAATFQDTMKNVALASTTFLPLARAHLFHKVDLSGSHDPQGTRRENLARFLLDQPHLARAVHWITYKRTRRDDKTNIHSQLSILLKELVCVKTLSITFDNFVSDIARSPPQPSLWRSILSHCLTSNHLTTLALHHIIATQFPLLEILSCPSLISVTFSSCTCSMDMEDEEFIDFAGSHSFNVQEIQFQEKLSLKSIPLICLFLCTNLRRFSGHGLFSSDGMDILPAQYKRPLAKLDCLDLVQTCESMDWESFLDDVERLCGGEAAFPALTHLSVGFDSGSYTPHIRPESIPRLFFTHVPSLRSFKAYGPMLHRVDLPRCLGPVGHHLSKLDLLWDFGEVFEDEYCYFDGNEEEEEARPNHVSNTLTQFKSLRLEALEDLSLTIKLAAAVCVDFDSAKELATIMSEFRGLINKDLFPSLQTAHAKISMMMYWKPEEDNPDEEEPYVQKAKVPLNDCLRGFVADETICYSWDVDVYSRAHTDQRLY
ncbi:hypothetical protein CVT24_013404 [Panaeolus cyanescens]|uniref:F-box domain-containing protein n=1 Tax=Panaeolus cyanescens TaxID=181874 RepID=A0A409YMJ1_9AGAR|nr:hypothetical protein CVT24_013404 [Panaeolus cyanescens]